MKEPHAIQIPWPSELQIVIAVTNVLHLSSALFSLPPNCRAYLILSECCSINQTVTNSLMLLHSLRLWFIYLKRIPRIALPRGAEEGTAIRTQGQKRNKNKKSLK